MMAVCIMLMIVVTYTGGVLVMDKFYNNTGGYIPQGVIDHAKSTPASLALYNSLSQGGLQVYYINLFYFLASVGSLYGFYLALQGAVEEEGIEVEAGRRFNRP